MGRSSKKGPFVDFKLLRKISQRELARSKEPIKTWARRSTISPEFVGMNFLVHNGRTHVNVYVTEEMVGHKLGEFAPTRVFRGHGGKATKKETAAAK